MTALLTMPTTVAYLLGAHEPVALTRALGRAEVAHDALAGTERLTASAYRTFDERVGGVLHKLLDIDLGGLVLDGWSGRTELADAVGRTRTGRAEVPVSMSDHRITSTHQPAVDVLAGGLAVTALRFDLVVTLYLRGVQAVVRSGLLVSVRRGQLLADAELSLDGRPLLSGTGRGTVGSVLRLGDGLLVPGGAGDHPEPEDHVPDVLHLPLQRRKCPDHPPS